MTDRAALRTLIERCEYVRVNTIQAGNASRTKPTEWQPVVWMDWASMRASHRTRA